jgi:hypothetical protein
MWRLAQQRENDKPDWDEFFKTENDINREFPAAVASIMQGNVSPTAIQVLEIVIKQRLDKPELGIKSPSRYIVAAIALATAKASGAADHIAEILGNASLSAMDVMLLYRALGSIGGSKAIQIIRNHLRNIPNYENSLWGQ